VLRTQQEKRNQSPISRQETTARPDDGLSNPSLSRTQAKAWEAMWKKRLGRGGVPPFDWRGRPERKLELSGGEGGKWVFGMA